MTTLYQTEQILMTVKTYPTPSTDYGETVCTAGIRLRDGAWIRIYPYPFRLVDLDKRFKKWQIIEVPLSKASRDPRPESFKLYDVDQIKLIREISPQNGTWAERLHYTLPTLMPSVQSILDGIPPKGDQNWGATIRPVEVKTEGAVFSADPIDPEWTPEELAKLGRAEELAGGDLFKAPLAHRYRKLEKVPYDFRLSFEDLTGARYDYKILDWEIAELFFKMRQRHGNNAAAVEKVRYKIEEEIFAPSKRVILILGNMHFQYKQQVLGVDGFIYPKRPLAEPMAGLFGD